MWNYIGLSVILIWFWFNSMFDLWEKDSMAIMCEGYDLICTLWGFLRRFYGFFGFSKIPYVKDLLSICATAFFPLKIGWLYFTKQPVFESMELPNLFSRLDDDWLLLDGIHKSYFQEPFEKSENRSFSIE